MRFGVPLAIAMLLAAQAADAVPEYIQSDQTAPKSVEESLESTEHAFRSPAPVRAVSRFGAFIREGALDLKLRNYYFHRYRDASPNAESWAQGGSLSYATPWWRDRLRLDVTLYTSQKLYGPADKDGAGLLKPGQNSFSVPGRALVEARLYRGLLMKVYRQTFGLPYLNADDSRMVPNTFESVALGDLSGKRFDYGLVHTWRIKRRDADDFISMTEAAGIDGPDRAVSTAGARYTFNSGENIGAVNHYGRDFMNIFYAEANSRSRLLKGLGLQASVQFTREHSVGEELGGDIDARTWGAKLAASYAGLVLNVAHTSTDNRGGIQSSWGGKPSYLSIMVKDFDRAGEDAWLLGLSSDFRVFGENAFSGFINIARGRTPDHGANASPDQAEFDVTLDYQPGDGVMRGLWFRLRGALVDQDGSAGTDEKQLRVILNYDFPVQ